MSRILDDFTFQPDVKRMVLEGVGDWLVPFSVCCVLRNIPGNNSVDLVFKGDVMKNRFVFTPKSEKRAVTAFPPTWT